MFKLNPDVSDVVETCGIDVDGVTLLRMGTVERGGSGCMCSEGTFLKAFMRHLLVEREDVAILDMEAGIEHLGRGTAENVDVFVVVVEPGARSVQTAHDRARAGRAISACATSSPSAIASDHEEDVEYLRDGPRRHRARSARCPTATEVRDADREGRSHLRRRRRVHRSPSRRSRTSSSAGQIEQ